MTAALYAVLVWLGIPSLSFAPLQFSDSVRLDALAQLPLFEALGQVGDGPLRIGDNLAFWLIAHAGVGAWRAVMLFVLLLTTAFVQYDALERGASWVEGFGTAICFSLNPTTMSVIGALSTSHVALCGLGVLAYFECARRALERGARAYVFAAAAGLLFALAFYELALLVPLVMIAYDHMFTRRGFDRTARTLYLVSGVCAAGFVALQCLAAHPARFWAGESPALLAANALRYYVLNFWVWFYPFGTFGVLVPDQPTGHLVGNAAAWLHLPIALLVLWRTRRSDPISAFGGIWILALFVPAGALLHFGGSPIAQHHVYIPMLGMAYPGVRLMTRWLELLAARLARTSVWVRTLVGVPLSLLLLWSLAPMVSECRRTLGLWGDERQLYLATLRNYPDSSEVLGRLVRDHLAREKPCPEAAARRTGAWDDFLDVLLMRAPSDSPAELIHEGHALLDRARYVEAGSALARALATCSSREQQLDAGGALVLALLHTDQRASAAPLLEHLQREHPSLAALDLHAN